MPSAPKRGSHGKCAWTGVERQAFSVGPPLNRSLLRAVFLVPFCFDTVLCEHLAYDQSRAPVTFCGISDRSAAAHR